MKVPSYIAAGSVSSVEFPKTAKYHSECDQIFSYFESQILNLSCLTTHEIATLVLESFGIHQLFFFTKATSDSHDEENLDATSLNTSEVDACDNYDDFYLKIIVRISGALIQTCINGYKLPFQPLTSAISNSLSGFLKVDDNLASVSNLLIIGLVKFISVHPDGIDLLFPLCVKLLDYWDPDTKSLILSGLLWLLEDHSITLGERWRFILTDSLSSSLLYYYDNLYIIRPSSFLYLKLNGNNTILLLDRFLATLFVGSERYRSTESWMLDFVHSLVVSSGENNAREFLLCWPSWLKFFERVATNTPPLTARKHLIVVEIIVEMLNNEHMQVFLREKEIETSKLVFRLLVWIKNVKEVKGELLPLLSKLFGVTNINKTNFIEELDKVNKQILLSIPELQSI